MDSAERLAFEVEPARSDRVLEVSTFPGNRNVHGRSGRRRLAENGETVDQGRGIAATGREQWMDVEKGLASAFSDGVLSDARVIEVVPGSSCCSASQEPTTGRFSPAGHRSHGVDAFLRGARARRDREGHARQLNYGQVTMLVQLGPLGFRTVGILRAT